VGALVEPWGLGSGAAARWLRQAKIFPDYISAKKTQAQAHRIVAKKTHSYNIFPH